MDEQVRSFGAPWVPEGGYFDAQGRACYPDGSLVNPGWSDLSWTYVGSMLNHLASYVQDGEGRPFMPDVEKVRAVLSAVDAMTAGAVVDDPVPGWVGKEPSVFAEERGWFSRLFR